MKVGLVRCAGVGALWRWVIALLTGLIVAALCAEGLLRLAGLGWPSYYGWDDEVGSVLRPNVSFVYDLEGMGHVRTNSRGLRDGEHDLSKPERTWRIAVLGDSMAEALQVDADQTFWSQLEGDLSTCPELAGSEIEAINFGVSGHGTAQELITLRKKIWEYEPDMILLAMTNSNDVRNNSSVLEPESRRPFFYRSGNNLVYDGSFRNQLRPGWQQALVDFANRTRVGQLGLEVARRLRARSTSNPDGTVVVGALSEQGVAYETFRPPQDQAWEEAWWITEQLISQMHLEVVAEGARFLGVMIPTGFQVDPRDDVRRRMLEDLQVERLDYPETRMEAFARDQTIPFQTLLDPFLSHAKATGVPLFGFGSSLGKGHLNEAGHHLMGQLVATQICSDFNNS